METIDLMRSLRAVRRYADRPIPPEAMRDILDVARWTGSAKNRQPWELVVVTDRAALAELATLGQYAGHLAGASCAIAIVLDDGGGAPWFDEGRLSQSLMLAAWAHGIGSCIGSIFPADNIARAKALLGIPDGMVFHTAIAFGYPADAAATRLSSGTPPEVLAEVRPGRKDDAAFVSWERYGQRETALEGSS